VCMCVWSVCVREGVYECVCMCVWCVCVWSVCVRVGARAYVWCVVFALCVLRQVGHCCACQHVMLHAHRCLQAAATARDEARAAREAVERDIAQKENEKKLLSEDVQLLLSQQKMLKVCACVSVCVSVWFSLCEARCES
jgi:hypothetical protein